MSNNLLRTHHPLWNMCAYRNINQILYGFECQLDFFFRKWTVSWVAKRPYCTCKIALLPSGYIRLHFEFDFLNSYLGRLFFLRPSLPRNVTTGVTGTTMVTPKFSDILILFQPEWEDSSHHPRGCTKNYLVDTSLLLKG